jgi:hypothetical protein
MDLDEDEIELAKTLADAKHPIWAIMAALTAILGALWMNGTV